MKTLTTIIALLLTCSIYGQNSKVPTIEATVTGKKITAEVYRDWEKIEKLYNKQYGDGNSNTQLTPSEEAFLENMSKKYEERDLEEYIWSVYGIGCSWYCGGSYETIISSELPANGNNTYGIEALSDDDIRTAWVEGVKGYGIGESITFRFGYTAARTTSVNIMNGYAKSEATWKNNSRVKTFNVYDDDKLIMTVNLHDIMAWQQFELPYPFPNRPDNYDHFSNDAQKDSEKINELKFVITDVYKGDKYDDTAISAFIFDGIDVHCLAKGTKVATVNGDVNIENLKTGDQIIGYNLNSKKSKTVNISAIHSVKHSNLLRLNLKDGKQIITTDDHPFLTNSGWSSYNPAKTKQYSRYSSLQIEKYDANTIFLIMRDGKVEKVSLNNIEKIDSEYETYTIELDDKEAGFIANGFIVGQE